MALGQTGAAEGTKFGVTAHVVLRSTIHQPESRACRKDADFSRLVKPQSIAKLLVFLVSDAAADTSGAVIPIYGRA